MSRKQCLPGKSVQESLLGTALTDPAKERQGLEEVIGKPEISEHGEERP